MQSILYFSYIFFGFATVNCIDTGFWYGATRPPRVRYDTVPYANLTVRVLRPFQEGPGQNLVKDPFAPDVDLFVGNTINRQTFDTQFILDMSASIGIDVARIYVLQVNKGDVHFTWESTSVIVNFIFLERNTTRDITLLEAIAELTSQIQILDSPLYSRTNVTVDIDPLWGLEVKTWDSSLKLTYPIEIVGGDAVQDGYYLNQGSLGICNIEGAENVSRYCEFERFFEDDLSRALNISFYRVQVLFIKAASLDSVLVHFRIIPPVPGLGEPNVTTAMASLINQVADQDSVLYEGNVTIRTDPTWGLSQFLPVPRTKAAKFTKKYYEYDVSRLNNTKRLSLITAYDRCKANRRCNWGVVEHDQNTNDVRFFQRLFDRGSLFETTLFLDFEDWRLGSRGFSWTGTIAPTSIGSTSVTKVRAQESSIRGAHFWPFDQASLGPDIPCFHSERNQGLVLDRSLQRSQIDKQEALIDDLQGRIDWLTKNIEDAAMDANLRSRKDVRSNLTWVRDDFIQWHGNEVEELQQLNSSQCVNEDCVILFNTSSLTLSGAINDTGVVRKTSVGTEVAVFTFNSIYLGPELRVIVVGQRALSLISKTTAIINTTIEATPGTLGGFPGGQSVARLPEDALSDNPRPVYICDLGQYCAFNTSVEEEEDILSNNVNGPGSGNLRVHPFVVETSAAYVQEIQVINTSAAAGQTLFGGFVVSFKTYSTPIIPHDVPATLLKTILEENLNLVPPAAGTVFPNRVIADGASEAGIGVVEVTRSLPTEQEGFTWMITFTTAIGDIDQLSVESFLLSTGSSISVWTERHGNEISGEFQLEFQGVRTAPIAAYESAEGFAEILRSLPMVSTAFVTRNDPTENCDDGLCPNGPYPSRGMLWTCYVTTDLNYDDVTPTSPTDPLALTEGTLYRFTASFESLLGINSTVNIYQGMARSISAPENLLNALKPFSLAYGGAGASYGGLGGLGYGINPIGAVYNDEKLVDLLGGSGGCMKSVHPFEINAILGPTSGHGGDGGGAIEIVSANDLTIGTFGEILVPGGDGEQTTQGGGGGGSGGSILLSSGATVWVQGVLDARGGAGGYGGSLHEDLSGGGGGGGRVAIYADSITTDGSIELAGGACGVLKTTTPLDVSIMNVSLYLIMRDPLNDLRVADLGTKFVELAIAPDFIDLLTVQQVNVDGIFHVELNMTIRTAINATEENTFAQIEAAFDAYRGSKIAEVVFNDYIITSQEISTIFPVLSSSPGDCLNQGSSGTLYTEALMTTTMLVKPTIAAQNTSRALLLSNRESTVTSSGSDREAPFPWNGPIVPFEASRPERITYYTRTDSVPIESKKSDYGSLFSLISRGESGLNISSVLGVYFGSKIMHGPNFGSAVDERVFLKRLVTIDEYPILSRWYKIDIYMQWVNHTYSISIDDTIVVTGQTFVAEDVDGIRLSTWRAVDVWFDEIYVGFDNTMEFRCPITLRTGTGTQAPVQRHWSFEEVHGQDSDGFTEYTTMTRHYNFLETVGSIDFDGQGQVKDFQDIKLQFEEGDYPYTQGLVHAGALVYLTNSLRSGKTPMEQSKTLVSEEGLWSGVQDGPDGAGDGRQFWYTEYNYDSSLTESLNGGVAACSSQDLTTWRFEGIVFHYSNLSDMVQGTSGPFYVERPKVLFNPPTGQYVMWAVMDDQNRTNALNAVATSPYEDGPFLFRRSFYPDGNRTRDQVIFVNDEDVPLLGRTYYQTLEFILPEAMMQPTWESAKSSAGTINYRSNYQRAVYDIGYDNFNDIYNQRWRKEDIPYKVLCENKITGVQREVPSGVYNEEGFICNDPEEKKIVIGQGNPISETRFVNPNDSENSWWRPTSVPAVEAQAWSSNYRDGYCGIRKLNDDFDINDPNLADFVPNDRSTCSNIADNPIHEAMQDKLIGVLKVITTRRAKYIAISELTEDYLDTTGWLNSFEGELESGDLISMIVEMGQFGFSAGDTIKSTFRPPVRSEFETAVDYKVRFSQFVRNYNDRAIYSLACVLDGVCPVNFKDQLTDGHL